MAAIKIQSNCCKSCGFCVHFCKHGVLKLGGEANASGYRSVACVNEEKCIGCGICAKVCGESVFTITR